MFDEDNNPTSDSHLVPRTAGGELVGLFLFGLSNSDAIGPWLFPTPAQTCQMLLFSCITSPKKMETWRSWEKNHLYHPGNTVLISNLFYLLGFTMLLIKPSVSLSQVKFLQISPEARITWPASWGCHTSPAGETAACGLLELGCRRHAEPQSFMPRARSVPFSHYSSQF